MKAKGVSVKDSDSRLRELGVLDGFPVDTMSKLSPERYKGQRWFGKIMLDLTRGIDGPAEKRKVIAGLPGEMVWPDLGR